MDAREIYPGLKFNYDVPTDYYPIVKSIGIPVIYFKTESYTGNTYVLFYDYNLYRYGYLTFEYGSCVVCDKLQGCENYEQLQVVIDEIENSVKWFDNSLHALDYFENHDWDGDAVTNRKKLVEFIRMVKIFLKSKIEG